MVVDGLGGGGRGLDGSGLVVVAGSWGMYLQDLWIDIRKEPQARPRLSHRTSPLHLFGAGYLTFLLCCRPTCSEHLDIPNFPIVACILSGHRKSPLAFFSTARLQIARCADCSGARDDSSSSIAHCRLEQACCKLVTGGNILLHPACAAHPSPIALSPATTLVDWPRRTTIGTKSPRLYGGCSSPR
jgi:hypothetical protein